MTLDIENLTVTDWLIQKCNWESKLLLSIMLWHLMQYQHQLEKETPLFHTILWQKLIVFPLMQILYLITKGGRITLYKCIRGPNYRTTFCDFWLLFYWSSHNTVLRFPLLKVLNLRIQESLSYLSLSVIVRNHLATAIWLDTSTEM